MILANAELLIRDEVLENQQQSAETFADVGGHRLLALVQRTHHVADNCQHPCPDTKVEESFPRQRHYAVARHHVVEEIEQNYEEDTSKGGEGGMTASKKVCRV